MVTSYTSRLVAGREPGSESSEEEAVPGWEDLGQIDGGPALTLELLPWESGLILGLSHVHRLKTWPRGLRIHPLSPEVCGDRSGRGHRSRRNRLDVRAPLNLASANAFLLSEHDLHLACAIASGLCDPVLPNCSHPRDIGPSTPKGTFWCLCLKCLAFSWEPLTHSSRPRSDAFPPLCFIILHP